MSDYKVRLTRFYKYYCAEKLNNVDELLQQMKGREDLMMEAVVKKYGPEPDPTTGVPPPQLLAALASSTTTAVPTSAPITTHNNNNNNNSNDDDNNNINNNDVFAPPTAPAGERSDAATTPRTSFDDSTSAKNASSNNKKTNEDDQLQREETKTINNSNKNNNNNNIDDDDDDFDVEEQLRTIVSKSGFLCHEHEHKWVQVWLGSLPLSLLTRETTPGKNPVIIQAWGFKNSRKTGLFKSPWKRRFFLVIPPFLYYSENDSPTAKALGCVYLAKSSISQEEKDGKAALKIETRVNRKPDALDSTGDAAPYFISFETSRVMDTWKSVLEKVSRAPYNSQTGQIETRGVGGGPGTAFSPLAKSFSGFSGENNNIINSNNNNNNSGRVAGSDRINNNNNINNNYSSNNPSLALTPSMSANQFTSAFVDFSVGTVPLSQALVREGSGHTPRSGYLGGPQQPQPYNYLQSGSMTPKTTQFHQLQQEMMINAASTMPHQQQQQQQYVASSTATMSSPLLPASAVAVQQQQQQQQQQVPVQTSSSSSVSSFPIDIKDLLGRVKRVSRDKDPQAVIELLFKHVENFPGDVGVIWKLMLAMDDAPLKYHHQHQQSIQQQQQQQPTAQKGLSDMSSDSFPGQQQLPSPQQPQQPYSTPPHPPAPSSSSLPSSSSQYHLHHFSHQNNNSTTAAPTPQQLQQLQQQQQQQLAYPSSTGSRSASFDLLPLNHQYQYQNQNQNQQPQKQTSSLSSSTQPQPVATSPQPVMSDAVQSALTRSSNRRQMIDQMLSGLPK